MSIVPEWQNNWWQEIQQQFPILTRKIHNYPLIYFDSAGTAQKPRAVIDAITEQLSCHYASVHRGVHQLAIEATEAVESARHQVALFINAVYDDEIVFVKGTTEGLNLLCHSFLAPRVNPGDTIVLTVMEHHANLIPWQQLAKQRQLSLIVIDIDQHNALDFSQLAQSLAKRPQLLAICDQSNVLGTINPIKQIAELAKSFGVPVIVDGAQGICHQIVDVQDLGIDFYVFSGHKLYGPSGIGVVWGKREHWQVMPPYQTGGGMIDMVTLTETSFAPPPYRFEAGTPHLTGIIGLAAAITWLQQFDRQMLYDYENNLYRYLYQQLSECPGINLLAAPDDASSIVCFQCPGLHAHDLGTMLDQYGIAVRVGHLCALPLLQRLQVNALVRVSLACYNHYDEIDFFCQTLTKLVQRYAKKGG